MPNHRLSRITKNEDPQGKFESETDLGKHGGLDPTLIRAATLVDVNIDMEASKYYGFWGVRIPLYCDSSDISITWARTAIQDIVACTT